MSTNARIGIDNGDKTVTSIYTHWDGYPDHHGPILLEHYQDEEKIRALMALGDLSEFDAELGEEHDFDSHGGKWQHTDEGYMHVPNESKGWCCAYGRDRKEEDVAAVTHPLTEWPSYGQAYEYVWREGRWFFRYVYDDNQDWRPLTLESK